MPDTAPAPRGTCLAFDFGEKRIGVAQGSAETATAHPLSTLSGGSNEQKFAAIAALIAAEQWPSETVYSVTA